MPITISTFYKFVAIDDPEGLKAELAALGCGHGIKGTILLAHEGVNATVSGTGDAVAIVLAALRADSRFSGLVSKESYAAAHPFRRFKVKVKPEIVSFGHPEVNPAKGAGTYVPPQQWNALIQQPDVVVVDTRNAYEYDIGTFRGARDPKTRSFREFAQFVEANLDPARDRRVAMFCTGGIRCEKSTAYLRSKGFEDVYHLEGGILKYLEVVPPSESLWQGECYIFDDRVALEHGVTPGHYQHCTRCGFPVQVTAGVTGSEAGAGTGTASACPNCAGHGVKI